MENVSKQNQVVAVMQLLRFNPKNRVKLNVTHWRVEDVSLTHSVLSDLHHDVKLSTDQDQRFLEVNGK